MNQLVRQDDATVSTWPPEEAMVLVSVGCPSCFARVDEPCRGRVRIHLERVRLFDRVRAASAPFR